jgi:hypothetical protein
MSWVVGSRQVAYCQAVLLKQALGMLRMSSNENATKGHSHQPFVMVLCCSSPELRFAPI